MISLVGKRALVTGGSRGIGAATALLLGACGADVAIGYRSRRADADAVAARLRALGVRGEAFGADISSREGAEELVRRAAEGLGGLDIFVANAGIWPAEEVPLAELTDERWRRTVAENLDSVFFTCRAAAQRIAVGGRIVLVASTAGQRGEAYHADYAATKGAVISLTKSLVGELAPRDVTVNCVAPGWVDTEMCADPFAHGGRERIAATIPLGRVACPEDIAGPIVFLCSHLAGHVTGEILNVNGGSVLCG
ncbi:MAG: SDR family NAD(P)-dependent oxidoreductase [Gemmatimonadaceae bacterium]